MKSTLELEVPAADLDDLSHVNNARFLEYLERGREHWYTSTGVRAALDRANDGRAPPRDTGTGQLEAAPPKGPRLGTVVVNIVVNFRHELFANDRLTITTRPLRLRRTSYVLSQAIRNQAGTLACDAEVTCLVMDTASRRPVALPDVLGRLFAS